ncbi:MAG TPA: threonine ammonia-lyase [Acidimicrobiales bacterium]|nr:threonine ammonia-lyase [Acidimicrobiales bacterium]
MLIGLQDVERAASRLVGVIRPTPTVASDSISRLAGRPVLFKPEHLQRTGSFKLRGAYNRVASVAESQPGVEVVAASAGNHAQGVALASTLCGLASLIFMPANAPLPKVEATRQYGARVELTGDTVDDCIDAARAYAAERGAVHVPPFDDPEVIAGQGTVGLELAAEAPEAEVVVVPVGGGGLISGIATALAHRSPATRVVGVEAAGAPSMRAALDAGAPVRLDRLHTMADGIALRSVSELTLAHVRAYVDDVVVVDEEEISRALLLLLERSKWVVEPAGAVGLAAVLAGRVAGRGPAAVVLSGGNVDPVLLTRLIDHGLSAAGRYLILRVVLDDRPGSLAALTAEVAALGLNVLAVEHHRSGARVAVDEVEVLLTLETRDPAHRQDVVARLRAAGYRAEPSTSGG